MKKVGRYRQEQGGGQGFADDAADGTLPAEADTEVAPRGGGKPVQILAEQGFIQAHPVPDQFPVFRAEVFFHDLVQGITRRQPNDEEHRRQQDKNQKRRNGDPARQPGKHRILSS